MSDYTTTLACKVLATRCCACRTPLLDAVSVELGIGPDCRKKYMPKALGGAARDEANQIVYRLALLASVQAKEIVLDDTVRAVYALGGLTAVGQMLAAGTESEGLLARLRTLGFDKLADKLEKTWVPIKLRIDGKVLVVETPYNENAVGAWRGVQGRRWDPTLKANTVPVANPAAAHQVYALLQRFYPGQVAIGPKGIFVVPTKAA